MREYSVQGYLQENLVMLVMLLGVFLVYLSSARSTRIRTEQILPFIGLGVVLASILQYLQSYYASLDQFTFVRPVLSAVICILYPGLIYVFVLTLTPKKKWPVLTIPMFIIVAYAILILFGTKLTSHYTEDNHFQRGALALVPYIITYIYLFLLFYYSRVFSGGYKAFRRNILLFIIGILMVSSVLAYMGMVTIVNTLALFCIFLYVLFYTISRKANAERELILADMQLYQRQIRPHFIYNGLGVIRSLLPGKSEAKDVLDHFTKYLRGNAELLTETGLIPVRKEYEIVENYLYMEKKRFEDSINIILDVKDLDFQLPSFTIQILVENAVQHGIRKRESGTGNLRLASYRTRKYHVIEVEDDGVGFDVQLLKDLWEADNMENTERLKALHERSGKTHIGMINLRKRLETLCGGRLIMESTPGEGTLARVEIPVNLEESNDIRKYASR